MKVTLKHDSPVARLFKEPKKQLANMVAVGIVYYGFTDFYNAHGHLFQFYLIQISLFSLVATHFGAISGAEAAIHTETVNIEDVENLTINQ